MRVFRLSLLLCAITWGLGGRCWAAEEARVLQPADLLHSIDMEMFRGLRFSPDGALAMLDLSSNAETLSFDFPTQDYSRTGYPLWASLAIYRTHVLDTVNGEITPLAPEPGIAWGGSWSPDGSLYAFYSDRSGDPLLWVWERGTKNLRQLPGPVARSWGPLHPPRWSSDGRRVLYKAVPEGMTRHDLDMLREDYRHWHSRGMASAPSGPNAVSVTVASTISDSSSNNAQALLGSDSKQPGGMAADLSARYLSDLVSVDVSTGEIVRIASLSVALTYEMSPDGRWVAVLEPATRPTTVTGLRVALRIYPANGGKPRTLADDLGYIDYPFSWSPSGDRVAYLSREGAHNNVRVHVVKIDGQRVEASSALGGAGLSLRTTPAWSADGKFFYVVDAAANDFSAGGSVPVGRLIEFSADGEQARKLVDIDGRAVRSIALSADRRHAWTPDSGRSLIAIIHDSTTYKTGFFRMDVASGALTEIAAFDASVRGAVVAGPKGRELFFVREDASRPQDYWALDAATGRARQVTHLQRNLQSKQMGMSRLVHWTSQKGEALRGALLLPPNYQPGKRYPLMVQVYGGEYGSDKLNRFGLSSDLVQFNSQLYAAHGYAVLHPDIPLHEFTPLSDYASAVLPAIDRVIELGVADPDKIAVSGQSFGGYGTLALLVQSSRFKAAVATNSAPSNMFAAYPLLRGYWMHYYEEGQSRMGGTPWEQYERYLQNSPFFFFDKIKTPLLIQRGDADPISEDSFAVYSSLKRLGQDVLFLEYEGEGHVLQQPQNVLDFWNRQYEFLDRYIDPTPR